MLKTSTSLEVDRPIERLKRINEEIYSEEIRFLEWENPEAMWNY